MLYVKYEPHSLLYGESIFWLMFTFWSPTHLVPNFTRTRSEHAVRLLPGANFIMAISTRISESQLFKSMLDQSFIIFQSLYLVTYVAIGVALNERILNHLGVEKSDSLTFKMLVASPTFFRLGLLVLTLVNVKRTTYTAWLLYDKLATLSVDVTYQLRVASWCLVGITPDAIACVLEIIFITRFAHSIYTEHNSIWPTSAAAAAATERVGALENYKNTWFWRDTIWLMYVIFSGIINIMVRYKPVLDLTYAATCISKHLDCVYSQISISRAEAKMPDEQRQTVAVHRRRRRRSSLISSISSSSSSSHLEVDKGRSHTARTLRRPKSSHDARTADCTLVDGPTVVVVLVVEMQPHEPAGLDSNQREIEDAVAGNANSRLFRIRNLYELERHLTQVQFLLGDLDRESPATILALTTINSMTFFYAVFYTSYHLDALHVLPALLYCAARALPLVAMFVAGSWLEQSARRMNDRLEKIYFEEHSHSLLYKQTTSANLSLARVFQALRNTRLTCNGLMRVNVETWKKCAIYIGTVILIVVQYDSLMGSPNYLAQTSDSRGRT